MNLVDAMRLSEILLGFAFALQSIEHLRSFRSEKILHFPRLLLALLLIADIYPSGVLSLLFVLALALLHRFQGPYNGGADRMGLLMLWCLFLVHIAPNDDWRELAIGYLALQLTLSYFISGWVKVVNPEWRNGLALQDVFRFSVYPVSESLRGWANHPRLLFVMSWSVMGFELLFPLALFAQTALTIALCITAIFHFTNACLFGLNRFFWIWISAYPSILWFQQQVFANAFQG
ncbi:MAG: HTTM domain-containing protein [Gammaproteobacteria bacterium]|nr:HTTM domain-containing protein [Gammaproteobacteria bacterium]